MPVDDPADPRLAPYVALTDAELRRRVDEELAVFVVEGDLAIRQLAASPYPVRSLLVTPAKWERLAPALAGVDAPAYVASRAVMAEVAGFDVHRGALAVGGRLPLPEPAHLLAAARRVAVLEGLNDHENLGALFRNAAAFGIDAVLLDPTCADPLYRRSIRVSTGHLLRVPFTRLDPWPDQLSVLGAAGFALVALTPGGDEPVTILDALDGRVAVLVGAEGPGLSRDALDAAAHRVRIPMAGGVDSLNVATAAAIAFHHCYR